MADNKNRTRMGLALGIGVIAGAALGLYLNSDRGRKVRKNVSDKVSEFGEKASAMARDKAGQFSEMAREKAHQLGDGMAHAVDRGRKWVDEVSGRIVDRMSHVEEGSEELVEETESHLQSGISKARGNIKKRSKDLERNLN